MLFAFPLGPPLGAGGREVDVGAPVGLPIRSQAVTGGGEHRGPEIDRFLQGRCHRIHRLLGPDALRTAPADRHHASLMALVVRGLADSVFKASVGIGCEIEGQSGARRGHVERAETNISIAPAGVP